MGEVIDQNSMLKDAEGFTPPWKFVDAAPPPWRTTELYGRKGSWFSWETGVKKLVDVLRRGWDTRGRWLLAFFETRNGERWRKKVLELKMLS